MSEEECVATRLQDNCHAEPAIRREEGADFLGNDAFQLMRGSVDRHRAA
jgi:hypothetical protein